MPGDSPLLPIISPYWTLLLVWRDLCWENVDQYPILVISLLFYGGTTLFVTVMAHRLRFRDYYLDLGGNALAMFIGCLFLWLLYVACFFDNWYLIKRRRVMRRDGRLVPVRNSVIHRGCVTLMAWTVLVYVMWAAAIPSMMQSRVRRNEAKVISLLLNYAAAQHQYQFRKSRGDPEAEYCDDFRRLYYCVDEGKRLALIPESLARTPIAFASGDKGVSISRRVMPDEIGYVFLEDPYVEKHSLWAEHFGLIAYPVDPGRSGTNIFWIGADRKILRYDDVPEATPLLEEQSPLHPEGAKLWEKL